MANRTITRKKDAPQPVGANRAAISKAKPRQPAAAQLVGDIRQMIEQARGAVPQAANAGLNRNSRHWRIQFNYKHRGQAFRVPPLGGRAWHPNAAA
jgi:hypothetical protein